MGGKPRFIIALSLLYFCGCSSAASQHKYAPDAAIPMERFTERVTKKPFGIYIDPATSPIQPERFSGYHTGTDFETLAGEENTAVPVRAICDGPIMFAGTVNGYGGVSVQACQLAGESVTVLYGHIAFTLSSIQVVSGTLLERGRAFATLGEGGSADTDGERKHLHLGIHKGKEPVFAGYAKTQDELRAWLNPEMVMK